MEQTQQTPHTEQATPSIYERLGGEPAIDAAVELFYGKVLADPLLSPFFDGTDMVRQKRKQKLFLAFALGGPNRYNGRGMRAAHAKAVGRGLTDAHFDAVVGHLGATLTELGVEADLIGQAAAIVETTRNDVLGR